MQKHAWFLCIIFVLTSLSSVAQQNFASISFGAALPQGDYGATEDLATSGYARPGGAIKFDAGYFPVSYVGIAGSFSFGSNFAFRDSLLNDMTTHIVENAYTIQDIPGYADTHYGSGFWNYINLFMGPLFSVRASHKLYVDFRALAGLSILRPPDQDLNISYDNTEISAHTTRNMLAFGYGGSTYLRYSLNSGMALKLGADFYQSKATYEYTFEISSLTADEVPPIKSDFFLRTLELTAGLAYSF